MSFTAAALLLAWIVIGLLALVCAGLVRRTGDLATRPAGADPAGLDARALIGFTLPSSGPRSGLRPSGAGAILFSSPSCPACREVLGTLATLGPRLVVVSLGGCDGVGELAPGARCIPDGGGHFDALGVPGAPYLFAVDAGGTVTSTMMPEGAEQVTAWLTGLTRAQEAR